MSLVMSAVRVTPSYSAESLAFTWRSTSSAVASTGMRTSPDGVEISTWASVTEMLLNGREVGTVGEADAVDDCEARELVWPDGDALDDDVGDTAGEEVAGSVIDADDACVNRIASAEIADGGAG